MTTTAGETPANDLLAVQRDLHEQALGSIRTAVDQGRAAERALAKTREDAKVRISTAMDAVAEKVVVRDEAIVLAVALGIPVAEVAKAADVSASTVSNLVTRLKKAAAEAGNGEAKVE
jgi:DNA-directed RNA polymerase specialized sigma24 family protein